LRVVGVEAAQGALLQVPDEESRLQRVELFGDVVFAVEVALVEDLEKDLLGQDVLMSISRTSASVRLGLIVSCAWRGSGWMPPEMSVLPSGLRDHLAQLIEHHG